MTYVTSHRWKTTRGEILEKRHGSVPPDFADLSDVDAARIAAFIDGEGTIGIWRSMKRGKQEYVPVTQITNTYFDLVAWLKATVGDGFVNVDDNSHRVNPKNKVCYRFNVNRRAIPGLLERIRPYLIIKGQQANAVIEFTRVANACAWGEPNQEVFEQFYLECKALNKRGT